MNDFGRTGVRRPFLASRPDFGCLRRGRVAFRGESALAVRSIGLLLAGLIVAACDRLPEPPLHVSPVGNLLEADAYAIAPGDELQIFVWRDADLSLNVRVRPDGRISMPLIGEIGVVGKTPAALGKELERKLAAYVQEPVVTVIVADYVGPIDQQVRVIGEASKPQSLTWRPNMTLLDVLVAVEGLTEFADGNGAMLVRKQGEETLRYRVRVADLLQEGDVGANAELLPGDVLIIPEAVF
ncbi:MAG: polysaccharide export protein [Geminicoccaceae bacterium]|nr:polysaccharide export protein [Geminicoccaceae bacterium]